MRPNVAFLIRVLDIDIDGYERAMINHTSCIALLGSHIKVANRAVFDFYYTYVEQEIQCSGTRELESISIISKNCRYVLKNSYLALHYNESMFSCILIAH